jgi:hypothetical protein
VTVISAVLVPVAAADKPIKEPAPSPSTFTGQFCADFIVQVTSSSTMSLRSALAMGA